MSDVMVAALSDRLEVYGQSQDRTLIDTPEALVESLGVMRTVAACLRQGSFDARALLNVCWLYYHRGTTGLINLSSSDLPVAGLLSILLEDHRPDQAAELPPMGKNTLSFTAENWCALLLINAHHLAQDPIFSAVVHEVLTLISRTTGDHSLRRRVHATAGQLLFDRYKFSDDISYLMDAVECLREAADPVVADDSDPGPDPTNVDGLGTTTYFLYEATHDVNLLVESVNNHARALAAGPESGSRRLTFLDNLGASLHDLALVRRDPALLWRAVDCFMEAAELRSTDAARWQATEKVWRTLAITCLVCRTAADLDVAIAKGYALLERHGDDPEYGYYLGTQAFLLYDRLVIEAVPELLDQYVDISRRAREAFPEGHPDRARANAGLGVALATRFEHCGDPSDRVEGLELLRAAATDLPDDLGIQDNLQKLEAAVIRRAKFHAKVGSQDQFRTAATDAAHLGDAYVSSGNPMFLAEGIRLAEDAVKEITPKHDLYCEMNAVLAYLWEHEAQRTDEAALLDRATAYARAGAAAAQAGTPERVHIDSRLSQLLRLRFEQRGVLADIQEAVRRGAAAARDARERHDRAIALNRLGLSLGRRYEHNRDLTDIRASLDAHTEAAELSTNYRQLHAAVLNNLGGTYWKLFSRHRESADLERAVECLRECVRLTIPDEVGAATRWDNLASYLHDLYELSGELAHLTEALTHTDRAVKATPFRHVERARRLGTLSSLLIERHRIAGDPADLTRAVAQARAAVRTCSADQPYRAQYLNSLGNVLLAAHAKRPSEYTLDEVLSAFDEARRHQPSLVHTRGLAAQNWATVHAAAGDTHSAIAGAEFAFDLLQQIDWHGMTLADRVDVARDWDGFSCRAAEWTLRLDDPARGVELLERGRGLLWGQLTSHVSDLERLKAVDPGLAEELLTVRNKAHELIGAILPGTARGEQLARVNAEHRQLISRIRALDGFDAFLGPPSPDRLAAVIGEGAVVVLNVTSEKCHAIVLRGSAIQAVPLAVRGDEVTEQVRRWTTVVRAAQAARSELIRTARCGQQAPRRVVVAFRTAIDEMGELLAWGWDALTGPVLDVVGHEWRRVWWYPTGPLTAFPLAATGHHDGSGRAVIDRVASSEAPTLRSLAEAHERGTARSGHRLLAVAVPTPYNRSDTLHGVQGEHAAVLGSTPIEVTDLYGPSATRETLLQELPTHSRFHFAGHGVNGVTDPTDAALSAFDAPLHMADLVGLPLDGAELAYLSTCHGVTGSATHPDESLHLAAAIHVVGFRHVIAARQEIDDRIAADAAAAFYRHLANTPDPGIALHETLREMRERLAARTDTDCGDPVNPWAWAGFVHLGPAGAGIVGDGAGADGR
ncbi:CHAT domain-containing protein [Streptomyces sp. NBC_00154]|uniref:CHAT domain-containing protein n=1 Tax=Streptomyces sp. NBC_00154 TaxID=2975670 RepID=UPI002252C3A3|nr:CHAT domain-containing protein [Streptomyces sp. NBC_00154]MCX5317977.1 CHAT domain-containing protein [Streptomyces sp. NBC_00154]